MRTEDEVDVKRERISRSDNTVDAILELCLTIDEATKRLLEVLERISMGDLG